MINFIWGNWSWLCHCLIFWHNRNKNKEIRQTTHIIDGWIWDHGQILQATEQQNIWKHQQGISNGVHTRNHWIWQPQHLTNPLTLNLHACLSHPKWKSRKKNHMKKLYSPYDPINILFNQIYNGKIYCGYRITIPSLTNCVNGRTWPPQYQ